MTSDQHNETVSAQPEPADKPAAQVRVKHIKIAEPELVALKQSAEENWDKFLRVAAELDNYRKRVAREKDELVRYTSERVVAALLPVLDNLERAIAAAENNVGAASPPRPDTLLDGLKQIHAQFRRTLEEFGLQEVIANAGHPFDPNLHEAVGHVESVEHPEGRVIEQLQRGYKLADRLLRPARVVVSKGQAESPANEATPKAES